MFHTLDELRKQEDEKKKKIKKSKSTAKAAHQYKKTKEDINKLFDKTSQKINLILYKNGFIVNNGKFRDKSLPENQKFLEEIQKGQVPSELKRKGYRDLGVLLENHRNEMYYPYQIIDLTGFNSNGYTNNYGKNYNVVTYTETYYPNKNYNLDNYLNYNGGNNYNGEYNNYQKGVLINNIYDNNYTAFQTNNNTNIYQKLTAKTNNNINNVNEYYHQQNVISKANTNYNIYCGNIYSNYTNDFNNTNNYRLNTSTPRNEPKPGKRGCYTGKREKPENKVITLSIKGKEEKEEEEDDAHQFKAFTGNGKQVGSIYLNELSQLKVDKCVTPQVNMMYPVCKISIRLFNGEIVNADFNFMSTLWEVYEYVTRVSKCHNFTLLEGFPPRPLRDLDRTIWELNLQNSTLTQKIY